MSEQKEIQFTAHERRVLRLSQTEPQVGPEAEALRKIIDLFPWMLVVAECNFDPKVLCLVVKVAAAEVELGQAVASYRAPTEDPK